MNDLVYDAKDRTSTIASGAEAANNNKRLRGGVKMQYQRYVSLLFLFTLFGSCLFSQGLNTTASKDDWEEINFEFNSNVLVDGYPSLLRLAELMQKNPGHRVRIEGHADHIGSTRYNERLGTRRAETVRDFLVKYGASASQLTTATFGEQQPKVTGRDTDSRFMNRRVFLTVTDAQGKTILDRAGVAETIRTIDDLFALQKKCCDDILKRLDRLDDIANMLEKMMGENAGLRKDLAGLREAHNALEQYVKAQPKPLTEQQTASIVDVRTAEQIERARLPRYSTINANAGADQSGNLTFTGRGRLFLPFKEQLAVQMQGEYMYFRDRQEGQFDIGLVNRFLPRAQAGIFTSFKHVNFTGRSPGRDIFNDRPVTQFEPGQVVGNGLLGQASLTLDYLFSRGRIGVFGSKGFLQDATLNRQQTAARNVFTEYYLRSIDQAGASTTLALFGDTYFEANLGYLKSRANADRIGGTARFVFPFSDRFAFTLEGGMNETLVSVNNTGRVVAGFQFGNFMRPRDYLEGYNGIQHAVPADVPRLRYEVLTRTVRTGNDAPVAVAGGDQMGSAVGQVTLDGSASYDPEGDALTYQWSQISGPSVSIAGMNTATATFAAVEGQSYAFRLMVRDPEGLQGIDTVTVTTTSTEPVKIVRFQASPDRIRSGQQSTLDWQVLNAQTVMISEVGTVEGNGTRDVSPTRTTQYRLTARNSAGEVSATTTIVVEEAPAAQFTACSVSPMNIMVGESATITYATSNAESVEISGIGPVDLSGSQVVTPTQTTSYTLTARNARGPVTCNLTVQVTQGPAPRVLQFSAAPTTINAGNAATLTWNVENAQTVSISTLGNVDPSGTRQVTPTETTTYTLTATNEHGSVNSTATVTVNPSTGGPTLAGCAASPATSPSAGSPVSIQYTTTNATSVSFSPEVPGAGLQGPVTVNPTASTTYTITATGANSQTASCTVAVSVTPTAPPPIPEISGGETIDTFQRELILDGSESTDPAGGALTFVWTPLETGAAILDQGQARTRVQIGGLSGIYRFRLTVRNAAGQEASAIQNVQFRSTTIP
jgi:outer membrane protein OmpA-like peptidoglycan-associated protein